MNGDLFRHEVLDARRTSWLGGISLARPLGMWAMTGFAAAMALMVGGVLAFGEYTRRSKVGGHLVPDLGLSTVVAPTTGVVGRLFPEEGEQVGLGDALARIDVPRVTASGSDALTVIREGLETRGDSLQALRQSQGEQIEAQVAGLSRQLLAARRELAQIENEITTRREQVRIGHEVITRYRSVADEQYVSQVQLRQQEQSVLELVSAQQSLERQATTIRRAVVQIEQGLRELPAQRDAIEAATRRDLALLEQERVQQEASGELLINAPVAGLVASRLIEAGQAIKVGQPLLTLLPAGSRLRAQLHVPSRAVGFIEPGDRVLLRYSSYPYQKFGQHGGSVLRVSRSAVLPESGMAQASEPHYRVLVELDGQSITAYGKPEPLRPGMLLEADILGERRRLYEWVLEPLYSLTGKMASSDRIERRQSARSAMVTGCNDPAVASTGCPSPP